MDEQRRHQQQQQQLQKQQQALVSMCVCNQIHPFPTCWPDFKGEAMQDGPLGEKRVVCLFFNCLRLQRVCANFAGQFSLIRHSMLMAS